MKLELKVQDYATNAEAHGKYRVANNATMQQILSKMLYSDPIESVIREISVNAFEAHYDAGRPHHQFDVTLPTAINPYFSIRDYGTGLSKEALESLYCTYGLSTKRETNDYTGGFGIGSKSPFAYTDLFYVYSYYDGVKYTVINSKNARDEFVYDILGEEETNEPNGLEITFEVKPTDFGNFREKCAKVYKWFSTPPKIEPELKINKTTIKESGNGWELIDYRSAYSYYASREAESCVVAGQVAYKIDSSHFTGNARTVLDKCAIIVHVGVGEVTVAPNRESLQYNKPTIEKISAVLNNFYKHTKDKVEAEVKNCGSVWEARLLAKKYFSNNSFISSILGNKFTYNGVTYDNRVNVNNSSKLKLHKFYYDKSDKKVSERTKHVTIDLDDNVEFAIYETGGYAAARRYVEQNQDVLLYVVPLDKKQELIDLTGILDSDLLYTNNFPAAVRQARVKTVGNKITAYRYIQRGGHWDARAYWGGQEYIDLDAESGYYCPIHQFYIYTDDSRHVSCSKISDFTNNVKIIGILSSRQDKVKNHKNWKHISELFKDKLDALSKSKEVQSYSDIVEPCDIVRALLNIKKELRQGTKLYKHLEHIEEINKAKTTVNEFMKWREVYVALGYTYQAPKLGAKVDLNFKLDDYPLLRHINRWSFSEKPVLDYINSVKV